MATTLLLGCGSGSVQTTSPRHGAFGEDRTAPGAAITESLIAAVAEPRRSVPTDFETTTEPWPFAGYEGRLISTPNYRIHTTVENPSFVESLPMFAELSLAHYRSALGDLPAPEQPLETYLFRDRRQWEVMTRRLLPDQAGMLDSLGRGGFTTRGIAVLYYIDFSRSMSSRDTFAIAAHEGWHQYTQTTFKHQLPVWLEEGVATYMESFSLGRDGEPQFRPWANQERRVALANAARRNQLIPLNEILQRSPQAFLENGKNQLLVYYAQVWALTRFLAEGEDGRYRDGLEQVLHDAAHGRLVGRLASSVHVPNQRRRGVAATSRTGPWIILEYFNPNLAEFEEQYDQFVRSLIERGRR